MSILQNVYNAIAKRIPTKRVTRFDTRSMLNEVASTLDVDRMADILRNAEQGDCADLFALYRDIIKTHAHLQGRFAERKEAVTGDTLNIKPFDKKNADDQFAALVIDDQIGTSQSWEVACLHLLDSTLYPVAVLEKVFQPSARVVGGRRLSYELKELVPVPHDLLDFTDGRLKIRDTDETGRPMGTSHEADPARYIIHRGHTLVTMPDNWGGPMRSLVFWWLLGTMSREWWSRFLDKYGTPFLVGKYDQADDASRSILERAFSMAVKLGGLVVSKETHIELQQAASRDGGEAFDLFHRVSNEEISKLILGQTLSSDAKATGMGSGVAAAQGEVRQDKRQSDAKRLGATFQFQLFADILRYNGVAGRAPMALWGTVSVAEMKASAEWLTGLKNAGLRVGDEGLEVLSERFGMPIERDPAPAAPAPGGLPGGFPMSIQVHSADGHLDQVGSANQAILRTGGARLAQALGKTYAPLEALIATAATPQEALARIETYCATLDPVEASDIIEHSLMAFAANGSVSRVS